jgi:hypothetical protein
MRNFSLLETMREQFALNLSASWAISSAAQGIISEIISDDRAAASRVF